MKKLLFALAALLPAFAPADATVLLYSATGSGYGYLETAPGLGDVRQGPGKITVTFVAYTSPVSGGCISSAVCRSVGGVTSSEPKNNNARASLIFAPGADPFPLTTDLFLGGTASNFVLYDGRNYLEFSGVLDHLTITVLDDSQSQFGYLNVGFSFSAPSVPEPASWAFMVAGFFGLGMAMRRRRPQPLIPCQSMSTAI